MSSGGQEQRLLSWQNLKRVPEDPTVYTSSTYYEYIEFASKNNQHRFRDIHAKNKCVKAYANCDDSDKCVVRILDFFKSKLPKDPKAVYLRPVEKVPSDPDKPWFVNVPVGVNTLNTIIARMCEKVEGIPKYTNHSLRATAASRLFEKNVPEKIIAERTGHRSLAGLRAYERTTNHQDQAACSAVSSKNADFNVTMSRSTSVCEVIKTVETAEDKSPIPFVSGTFHGCTFNF